VNVWRKLLFLLRRKAFDRDLAEEMRIHVEFRADRLRQSGMDESEADLTARRAFGNTMRLGESSRKAWTWQWLEEAGQDLRYGFRVLFKNPGSTILSILTLALGIGANTATFTAYKAMVARPLDARDPTRMVNIGLTRGSGVTDPLFSYPDYQSYRESIHSFNGVVLNGFPEHLTLSGVGEVISQRTALNNSLLGKLGLVTSGSGSANVEFTSGLIVSENYFSVLGVTPLRGRTFESMTAVDLTANPAVLISENFWQKRFANDPSVVGKTVRLNGAPFTVIGVMPRDFVGTFIAVPDFWIPISLEPFIHPDHNWLRDRENQCCRMYARLADGVSINQAQAEMSGLTGYVGGLHDSHSDLSKPASPLLWTGSPFPLPLNQYGGLITTILLIMVAVGMVLVVACANVASIQLARSTARQNELRIRMSLGASRARIVRQLLTESGLLGLIAGIVALLSAWAFLRIVVTMAANILPTDFGTLIFYVTPDLGIFTYVLAVSLLASILFGLVPAFESSRSALPSSLKGNGGAPIGRSRRLQDLLVATQVAISLTLLIAGGILIRSSMHALNTETGYDDKRVIDLDLQFPEGLNYKRERKLTIVRDLRTRLAALPGVTDITSASPPNGQGLKVVKFSLNGERPSLQDKQFIFYNYVQSNYFDTLGIPLLSGRGFRPESGQNDHSVIISDSAARELWPGQNPIGQTLRLGTDEQYPTYEVIGVARDTLGVTTNGADVKKVYVQLPLDGVTSQPILIRTETDPVQLMKAVQGIVASVDPDLASPTSTLQELLSQTPAFTTSVIAAMVASTIGLLGLLLASMGIYGTVNYLVALRTREVGIRLAIGAQKRDIIGLILRESTRPVFLGLVAGMFLSVGAFFLLRGVLSGLNAFDALISFIGVSLLFLVIALLASYLPSRRATRVDPMVALRCE